MPSLSRRRFFGLVAGAAVASPVAIAAAPALIDELAALQAAYVKPAYDRRHKIGDTIMVKRPVRFVPIEHGGYEWTRDDYLPVTLATPEAVALYRSQHPTLMVTRSTREKFVRVMG